MFRAFSPFRAKALLQRWHGACGLLSLSRRRLARNVRARSGRVRAHPATTRGR
ncbi:MAG: TilS substrate-binding domain-containing protein [Phycisphaerae bacterium]|nr:MAG: hypothetical protein EDS66_03930 [Planctomycetota bacterium]KAB2947933.1 MAG: hypothetical protein F9K17_06795 [Phycisphaerae bacterium]MBE7456673.1 TilS substrate-binding domain-containing protein [Planctomycetia bacterium]MCL4718162.1 TilS substrate-binding domain-containing protein [Phycisphaerae bacterium]MCQ3920702.1 hypothetical protein [Planctomycetota bacterium]